MEQMQGMFSGGGAARSGQAQNMQSLFSKLTGISTNMNTNLVSLLKSTAAITGIGLGVAGLVKLFYDSSPLLQGTLKIINQGIMFMLRPIADIIAITLRPIALIFLTQVAIPFYKLFVPFMKDYSKAIGDFYKDPQKALYGLAVNIINWPRPANQPAPPGPYGPPSFPPSSTPPLSGYTGGYASNFIAQGQAMAAGQINAMQVAGAAAAGAIIGTILANLDKFKTEVLKAMSNVPGVFLPPLLPFNYMGNLGQQTAEASRGRPGYGGTFYGGYASNFIAQGRAMQQTGYGAQQRGSRP